MTGSESRSPHASDVTIWKLNEDGTRTKIGVQPAYTRAELHRIVSQGNKRLTNGSE